MVRVGEWREMRQKARLRPDWVETAFCRRGEQWG